MTAFNAWGNAGNEAFALPMVQQFPTLPTVQGYVLAWDTANQAIGYFPMSFAANGDVSQAGNFGLTAGKVFQVNGVQVVGARNTGWTAMTGTPLKTTFDTATVTLAQLAGVVMALQAAALAHGSIGV